MHDERTTARDTTKNLKLLAETARLAHGFGVTSGRLQAFLLSLAEELGYTGSFRVTPSSIMYAISEKGREEQLIRYIPLPSPGFQLTRLAWLSKIMNRLEANELTVDETLSEIRKLESLPDTFGPAVVGLAYGGCGAGFAVLLSLGWTNVAIAFLGSLLVYALVRLAERIPMLGARLEFLSAFIVSLLAYLSSLVFPGMDASKITLCSLVVLVPGFGLTVGVSEFAAGLIMSGLERLSAAIMSTFKLFFGAIAGWVVVSVYFVLPEAVPAAPHATPLLWGFATVLVISLAVIFQADLADLPWIVLAGVITYAGMEAGGQLGFWQGSFLGAAALGFAANTYARNSGRPALIIINPVVMMLVPGAATLLGLQAGATAGAASGFSAEWHAFLNIAAILAGLMVAYVATPSKTAL
ncbi:MAG: threonine/serine exporter family protein [Roseibium sp.]|uniref:threonine/serine ThrE exporter family protein n=1 Tax=Roseibium sp. TaxID=1936156 RepID=UPI003D9C1627